MIKYRLIISVVMFSVFSLSLNIEARQVPAGNTNVHLSSDPRISLRGKCQNYDSTERCKEIREDPNNIILCKKKAQEGCSPCPVLEFSPNCHIVEVTNQGWVFASYVCQIYDACNYTCDIAACYDQKLIDSDRNVIEKGSSQVESRSSPKGSQVESQEKVKKPARDSLTK